MAAEIPKYVRKRCEHGKYSFQCKECGGGFCEHGRRKHNCKECGGSNLCVHSRIKNNCVECNGSAICPHQKRRSRCVECKGGSICEHEKLRSRCKECGGTEICEHGTRKYECIPCMGSSICEHNKRRSRCAECGGSELCEHKHEKHNCVECGGKNVCEHRKLHYQCVECHGRLICEHNVRKSTCNQCDGSYICPHSKQKNQCITCNPDIACHYCKSISILQSRWTPYCFRCYCVLHPDAEIPRKFKLKEHYVRNKLMEHFQDTLTIVFDKKIPDGCSRHRPDIFIDFGSHCLVIEVDEHRHRAYECEMKRMTTLFEDVYYRSIIFLRFNPDGYTENTKTHRSPFEYTPTGLIRIHEGEMKRRMVDLTGRIQYHKDHLPAEPFLVEYLFYGDEEECKTESYMRLSSRHK